MEFRFSSLFSSFHTQDKLHTVLEEIEMKFENDNIAGLCRTVIVDGIYLAAHEESATDGSSTFRVYRVKIKEINEAKKMALCFYIDDGFEEWLSYDLIDNTKDPKDLKIYRIPADSKLLEIPPQAVHLSLYNLEDFAENPHAIDEACKCLSDRQFLARIKTTQEQYEAQQNVNSNSNAKLSVVLYDMKIAGENVLMNKMILENICAKLHPPQLEKRQSLVNVTHINDFGDIYCRLYKSKEMQSIEDIINRLTTNGIDDAYRVNVADLTDVEKNSKNLRLVFDTSNNRWFRAVILPSCAQSQSRAGSNTAMCKFIDYGYIKDVEHEHIYKLEKLSTALNKYPHQTIVVRLNGLDSCDYTPKVIERLCELLCSPKAILIVQPISRTDVPQVNIWKRIEKVLCKINDTIRMEMEMEK